MSKGILIALLAALAVGPSLGTVCTADEPQTTAKQDCCEKEKGCCDQGKDCDSDLTTACKCSPCSNSECDKQDCSCDSSLAADCQCASSAAVNCDKPSCRNYASGCTDCDKADCANKKCGSRLSSDALTACSGKGRCAEKSALRMAGHSLLDVASPSSTAATEAIWQLIAKELEGRSLKSDPINATPLTSPPKTSVYLVVNGKSEDFALSADCDAHTTVNSVLRQAVLPYPVNFAAAEITVRRARTVVDGNVIEMEEKILPVQWDQSTGQPTQRTNHALEPNDRLCVKLASSVDEASRPIAAKPTAPSATALKRFMQRPAQDADGDCEPKIQYSIQIIEDSRGCLDEYEPLRRGVPMMCAESKTLLPAMRVMHKHKLIQQLSSPKLICTAGQTAELEIRGEPAPDGSNDCEGVRLAVASERADNGLMLELAMHATKQDRDLERRLTVLVEPGQTIVLNTQAPPQSQETEDRVEPAVYVVVTPEVVK